MLKLLFDFVTVQLGQHYARRLCDVANGRQPAAPVLGSDEDSSLGQCSAAQVSLMERTIVACTTPGLFVFRNILRITAEGNVKWVRRRKWGLFCVTTVE